MFDEDEPAMVPPVAKITTFGKDLRLPKFALGTFTLKELKPTRTHEFTGDEYVTLSPVTEDRPNGAAVVAFSRFSTTGKAFAIPTTLLNRRASVDSCILTGMLAVCRQYFVPLNCPYRITC